MSDTQTVEYIDHNAEVISVDPRAGIVEVDLSESYQCEGCAAAKLCNPQGLQKKSLSVHTPDADSFHVGQHVVLRGTERLHRKAIMIATVIPSISLIAVMVLIYILTASQFVAAMGGIVAMIFFFLLLWLMRDRLAHEFNFEIIR